MTHTFIDLFAGIGGMRIAFAKAGARCVFTSEWDKHARATYEANFLQQDDHIMAGDITKVDPASIPDHDILVGGFPCQPFSTAGVRRGFADTRGTMFFHVAEILRVKRPRAFFLENVRGLLNHDGGNTFATIKQTLEDMGYSFHWKLVFASDFGLPQRRPRLFMVGFRDKEAVFTPPTPYGLSFTMSDVWGGECAREVGFTLRCSGRGSGLRDRHNWDSYLVDGVERRLTPKEAKRMQGFPDSFIFPVSEAQAMKQLGNSVAIPAVHAYAAAICRAIAAK